MIDGVPMLEDGSISYGLIGATLLDKLDGFIPGVGHESVIFYAAKKNLKIRAGRNPFRTNVIKLNGRFSYNKEINAQAVLLPLEKGQELLDSDGRLTAMYIDVLPQYSNEEVKELLQSSLGGDFEVKTNYEKNELIYKTSKSEKLIVLFILLFIFILAAFNLVASLTMLFVEKLENLKAMQSFGASKNFLFKLFFYEGMLISGRGIVIGMALGYAVCFLQLRYHLLLMPNSGGEPFPISVNFGDTFFILFMVVLLALIFTVIPIRFLIRRNIPSN
jgi:lipoprotein-releasing system permease protein